jgi:hypothetical protein
MTISFPITIVVRDYTSLNLSDVIAAVKSTLQADMFDVERTSKANYLTGPRPEKLGVVTGALRTAVKGTVESGTNKLSGVLGIGPHVWYGKLHEEGDGGQKKRPFLVPAIKDHLQSITDHITDSVNQNIESQIK